MGYNSLFSLEYNEIFYSKLQLYFYIHLKSTSTYFCQIVSLLAISIYFLFFKKRVKFREIT
jgi:hypothetical protein